MAKNQERKEYPLDFSLYVSDSRKKPACNLPHENLHSRCYWHSTLVSASGNNTTYRTATAKLITGQDA
jgi:hypothetical protein